MEERQAAADPTPTLKVLGAHSKTVDQFGSYVRCADDVPLGFVCDEGATATDKNDGVLTPKYVAGKGVRVGYKKHVGFAFRF